MSKSILFIGGDQRHIEMISKFKNLDYNVHLLGFDYLSNSFLEVRKLKYKEVDFSIYNYIILPVGGINDDGSISSLFSNEKILFTKNDIMATAPDVIIFTGIISKYIKENFSSKNVVSLMDMDEVAIMNAVPTIEGTIMMLIENTDYTIFNSDLLVLGYGRVGEGLVRSMQSLGAKLKVVVNNTRDKARIENLGIEVFMIQDLDKAAREVDIIINTIPARVIDKDIIDNINLKTFILDLASLPGGVDISYATKCGIKAVLAPGLPGIVAPKTAGEILSRAILEVIDNG